MTAQRCRAFVLGWVAAVLIAGATPARGQGAPFDLGLLIAEQSRPSFTIIGAGSRAAGMGGAFTALADDASAASFNPAGLALLIKPEVSAVLGGRRTDQEDSQVVGLGSPTYYSSTQVSYDTSSMTFAALTVPLELWRRNLCLQLSYHRLIDLNQSSDRQFTGTRDGSTIATVTQRIEQTGAIDSYSLAAAYQVTQRMSLGLAMNRWKGGWTFSAFNELREGATPQAPFLDYRQRVDIEGWNWNLGILLRYPLLNVGLIYRTPFDASFTLHDAVSTNITSTVPDPSAQTYALHWPSSWTAGVALKPTETWRVTADYAKYYWSKMEVRGVEITAPDGTTRQGAINFFDLQPAADSTTEDAGNWRFGTELTLFAWRAPFQLRAGYFRDQQPQRLLSIKGEHRVLEGYTAGAGVKLGPFAVDLAYQYSRGSDVIIQVLDPRVVATPEPTADQYAVGRRAITEHRVYLSFLYQFSREKTDRALRYLFVGPQED